MADVTVVEGDGGPTNAVFTVTLSEAAAATVTVNLATRNSSALSGSDYTAKTGTLTFEPGVRSQSITVAVTGDFAPEATEQFVVDPEEHTTATHSPLPPTCRLLLDNTRTLSMNDVTVVEGDGGFFFNDTATTEIYTLALHDALPISTRNSSALSGSDYTAKTGTLTFEPGVRSQSITVAVTGDFAPEATEQFVV